MRAHPRVEFVPKRRPKKKPTARSLLHVEWLIWLVDRFGAPATADWEEPPISFEAWQRARELAAHWRATTCGRPPVGTLEEGIRERLGVLRRQLGNSGV